MADVIRQLFVEFGQMGQDILVKGLQHVKTEINKQAEAAGKLRTSYLFLAFGMLAAGGLMSRFGRQLKQLSDQFTDTFLKVEQRAAVVSTVLFGTLEALTEISDEVFVLAKRFGEGVDEIGELMRDLAAAGFTMEQTFAGAAAALKLARIANLEGADAVRILVGAFFALGFQAKDTAEANQVLSGIVSELADAERLSAVEAGELGESLKFVASTAQLVGLGLEEILAVLVIAGNQMIRAGIAGRALRVSLLRLAKVTGQLAGESTGALKIVRKYNLELLNQQGEIKGLADLVDELNTKLEGLTGTQKVAVIGALFGTRATALWSAVMNEGAETVRYLELRLKAAAVKEALFIQFGRDMTDMIFQWRDELQEGETALDFFIKELGIAPDMAIRLNEVLMDNTLTVEQWTKAVREAAIASEIVQARLQTLRGTLDLLKESTEVLYASFGRELAPVMAQFARLVKMITDLLAQMPSPLKLVIGLLLVGGAAFLTMGGSALQAVGSLIMLMAATATLAQVQKKQLTTQMLLIVGMKQLTIAAFSAAKAVLALAWSFLKLLLYAAPFILVFLLAEHVFRKVNEPLGILIALLGFLAIAAVLHTKVAAMATAATGAWAASKVVLAGALGVARAALIAFWTALGPIGIALLVIGIIVGLVATYWDEITAAFRGFYNWIKPKIMPILKVLFIQFKVIGIVIKWLWKKVLEPFIKWWVKSFGQGVQFILNLFRKIIDGVKWVVDAFQGLGSFFAGLFGGSTIPDMIERGVLESTRHLDMLRKAAEETQQIVAQPAVAVGVGAGAGVGVAGAGRPEVNINITIANPVVATREQVADLEDVVEVAVRRALDEWDSAFDRERPRPIPVP